MFRCKITLLFDEIALRMEVGGCAENVKGTGFFMAQEIWASTLNYEMVAGIVCLSNLNQKYSKLRDLDGI